MWSPQQYLSEGNKLGHSDGKLKRCVEQIEAVSCQGIDLPSILSLNHLAVRTDISYNFLRGVITNTAFNFYKSFSIRKRSGGRRYIYIPKPSLMYLQRWINIHILQKINVHSASFAFTKNSSIYKCANRHAGAQWLIKMDITGFFESISEIQVYRVFKSLGYQPLVAFELARICTITTGGLGKRKNLDPWKVKRYNSKILAYNSDVLGYLPQGAPTSPMLSNLVMKDIDQIISKLANERKLTYTRYSDDLTFSTREKGFSRKEARMFIGEISKILCQRGFHPNNRKTKIVPPGSRKIVLGLLVDGDYPRLRKEFKDNIRQHLYYADKDINTHASSKKFKSSFGLKNHLEGLIIFASSIEPDYGKKRKAEFDAIDWP